jgi:hypothetical protein
LIAQGFNGLETDIMITLPVSNPLNPCSIKFYIFLQFVIVNLSADFWLFAKILTEMELPESLKLAGS